MSAAEKVGVILGVVMVISLAFALALARAADTPRPKPKARHLRVVRTDVHKMSEREAVAEAMLLDAEMCDYKPRPHEGGEQQ